MDLFKKIAVISTLIIFIAIAAIYLVAKADNNKQVITDLGQREQAILVAEGRLLDARLIESEYDRRTGQELSSCWEIRVKDQINGKTRIYQVNGNEQQKYESFVVDELYEVYRISTPSSSSYYYRAVQAGTSGSTVNILKLPSDIEKADPPGDSKEWKLIAAGILQSSRFIPAGEIDTLGIEQPEGRWELGINRMYCYLVSDEQYQFTKGDYYQIFLSKEGQNIYYIDHQNID